MKYPPCSKYTKHKCPHILQAKFVLDVLKPASQRIEVGYNHPGREAEHENEQDDEEQEEYEGRTNDARRTTKQRPGKVVPSST